MSVTHPFRPFEPATAARDVGASVRLSAAGESRAKRVFDVLVAVLLLLLFLPLLLVTAAALKLETPGPVLFRQARTGLGGRPFQILKLRSMHAAVTAGAVKQTERGDPRVTRVGRVIRALSIDELPQLLNVVRGEMSLVGPRPHAISHDQAWAKMVPGYARRFSARPGLTGLAQVQGHRGEISDPEALRRRIEADLRYIDHWSFGGDIVLMLRTAPCLLHDPAAY